MQTDQEILSGDGVHIVLCGQGYEVPLPARRRSRALVASAVKIMPRLEALRVAMREAGVTDPQAMDAETVATLPTDTLAGMLEVFDPICDWLLLAVPGLSDDVVNEADEAELVKAFLAVQEMVQRPFASSGSGSPNSSPKQTGETRPQNTSAAPQPETHTQKAECMS